MAIWRSVVGLLGRTGVRHAMAGLFSVAVFLLALAVLHRVLGRFDLREVLRVAAAYPAEILLGSLLLAASSYLALGGFDWLGLHHVKRSLPLSWTLLISFVSHAVSHNAGFAVLTGGSVRLRMYSTFGLGVAEVGGIVAFAGLSFGLGVVALSSAAFVIEGARIAPLLHLPPAMVAGLGWAGLVLLVAYFLWTALARRPLAFAGWRLATPSLPLALGQIAVAATDLALVSGALYLLLPLQGSGIGYAGFVGIYVVATIAGTLSHVPGGLGVFEGALTLLLPGDAAPILAALLVFRVFYNLVPLVTAALVLAVFELVQRRRHVAEPEWVLGLGPALGAALVFAAGVLLLWSGTGVGSDLPALLAEPAHLVSGGCGGLLLVLSWGLLRQSRQAYVLALPTLALGALLALMRGPDWPAAGFLALAAAALAAASPLFVRRHEDGEVIPWGWVGAAAAVILGGAWLVWHGDPRAWRLLAFGPEAEAARTLRADLMAAIAVAAAMWELRRKRI